MNALPNGQISLGCGHQFVPINDGSRVIGAIRHDSMDVALVVREDDGQAHLHAWRWDGRLISRCQPLLDSLNADTIPHCTNCEENPAAEGDECCLPCAQLRDAQPVRQEDAETPFRAGNRPVLMLPDMCEETEAAFMEEFSRLPLPHNQHPVIDYAWPESSAQAYREACKKELLAKLHANAQCDRRTCPHCQEERATFTRIDDGYRKQAFVARGAR